MGSGLTGQPSCWPGSPLLPFTPKDSRRPNAGQWTGHESSRECPTITSSLRGGNLSSSVHHSCCASRCPSPGSCHHVSAVPTAEPRPTQHPAQPHTLHPSTSVQQPSAKQENLWHIFKADALFWICHLGSGISRRQHCESQLCWQHS